MSNPEVLSILEALACGRPGCECAAALRAGHGKTHCPGHRDREPSLVVNPGDRWPVVWNCKAGCGQKEVQQELIALGLLKSQRRARRAYERVSVYRYSPTARKVRCLPRDGSGKFFFWEHPREDGKGWRKRKKHGDIPLDAGLYRFRELPRPPGPIWLPEGEKAVDLLWELGQPATCNPNGAGEKGLERYSEQLAPYHLLILPDNDISGTEHALRWAQMHSGWHRMVELPGLPDGGDVWDWIVTHGHAVGELLGMSGLTVCIVCKRLMLPGKRGHALTCSATCRKRLERQRKCDIASAEAGESVTSPTKSSRSAWRKCDTQVQGPLRIRRRESVTRELGSPYVQNVTEEAMTTAGEDCTGTKVPKGRGPTFTAFLSAGEEHEMSGEGELTSSARVPLAVE